MTRSDGRSMHVEAQAVANELENAPVGRYREPTIVGARQALGQQHASALRTGQIVEMLLVMQQQRWNGWNNVVNVFDHFKESEHGTRRKFSRALVVFDEIERIIILATAVPLPLLLLLRLLLLLLCRTTAVASSRFGSGTALFDDHR